MNDMTGPEGYVPELAWVAGGADMSILGKFYELVVECRHYWKVKDINIELNKLYLKQS